MVFSLVKTMSTTRSCSQCGKDILDDKKSGLCKECRSRLGKNNKHKGASQERRITKILQKYIDKYDLGFMVRRTPRSGAIHELEPSDFLFTRLPRWSILSSIHFESKVGHNWSITDWFNKAVGIEKDRGTNRHPVIVARKPGESRDYAIVDYELFADIVCRLDMLTKDNEQ